jgi:uncharacterized membrane protein YeaQ/YmgE (transglycosylase-associated protein family)
VLILAMLVLGLAAGWVAHLLVAHGEEKNWGQILIFGVVGSFLGGLLTSLIFGDGLSLRPSGLIGSIIGATLVTLLARAFGRRPAHSRPRKPTRG